MSLLQDFLKDISKADVNRICALIGDDEDLFKEMFTTVIDNHDLIVTKRGLWVLRTISDSKPYLFNPYFENLLDLVRTYPLEDSVLRNVIGIWQVVDIPEKYEGEVYDLCLGFLQNDSAIAAKAFSLDVCYRIAIKYPELKPELKALAEDMLLKYQDSSPAIISRARRLIKRLRVCY